jgi:hypothetical protein
MILSLAVLHVRHPAFGGVIPVSPRTGQKRDRVMGTCRMAVKDPCPHMAGVGAVQDVQQPHLYKFYQQI